MKSLALVFLVVLALGIKYSYGCGDGCENTGNCAENYECKDKSELCELFKPQCENFFFRKCIRCACPKSCGVCHVNEAVVVVVQEQKPISESESSTEESESSEEEPTTTTIKTTTTTESTTPIPTTVPTTVTSTTAPNTTEEPVMDEVMDLLNSLEDTTISIAATTNATTTESSTVTSTNAITIEPTTNATTVEPTTNATTIEVPITTTTIEATTNATTTTLHTTTTEPEGTTEDTFKDDGKVKCQSCEARRKDLKKLYEKYYPGANKSTEASAEKDSPVPSINLAPNSISHLIISNMPNSSNSSSPNGSRGNSTLNQNGTQANNGIVGIPPGNGTQMNSGSGGNQIGVDTDVAPSILTGSSGAGAKSAIQNNTEANSKYVGLVNE